MPKKLKNKPDLQPVEPKYDLSLGEDELLSQLSEKQGSILWLGKYTTDDILRALQKAGIVQELDKKGLTPLLICIEPLDTFQQALKVYSRRIHPDHLLAEARFRHVVFRPRTALPESFSAKRPEMLAIDWLMMQNPFARFTSDRPPLPGQQHPGLGVARKVLKLLKALAKSNGFAGILNFPQYFHNAYLYRQHFQFYHPAKEATLYALARDLEPLSISQMSWAIEGGCVINSTSGKPFEWESDVQILPLSPEISRYFASQWYRTTYQTCWEQQHYVLDRDTFQKLMKTLKKQGESSHE